MVYKNSEFSKLFSRTHHFFFPLLPLLVPPSLATTTWCDQALAVAALNHQIVNNRLNEQEVRHEKCLAYLKKNDASRFRRLFCVIVEQKILKLFFFSL